jgi:hypothetical protein
MHWTASSRAATDSLTLKRLAEANKLDEKLGSKPEKRLHWALPKAKGEGKVSGSFVAALDENGLTTAAGTCCQ